MFDIYIFKIWRITSVFSEPDHNNQWEIDRISSLIQTFVTFSPSYLLFLTVTPHYSSHAHFHFVFVCLRERKASFSLQSVEATALVPFCTQLCSLWSQNVLILYRMSKLHQIKAALHWVLSNKPAKCSAVNQMSGSRDRCRTDGDSLIYC